MLVRWLSRWLRATFDYNPSFPLSALLLLAGVRLLATDGTSTTGGTIDAGSPALTALGLSIFQAYELLTLGVALLVLWPRRIAYETTSILRVFGVVRFAAPFLLTGLALDFYDGPASGGAARGGHPGAAVLMGLVLTGLMILKGELITKKIGLDLHTWERRWDYLLFGLAAIGYPLLANRLSVWTGDWLNGDGARLLQLGLWWGHAALLAPMALGLPDLGRSGPLRSRRPAAWWRVLSGIGYTVLLANVLHVSGTSGTPLVAFFPILLVGVAVTGTIGRAAGLPRLLPAEHLPALLGGALLVLDPHALLGELLTRPVALLAWIPVAALSLPLLAPGHVRAGLRSVGGLVALAPVQLLQGADAVSLYLLALACLGVVVGLVRREELLVAGGAATGTVAVLILTRSQTGAFAHVALDAAALLSLALALRLPHGLLALRLAAVLYAAGSGAVAAHGPPDALLALELLASAGALLFLGQRAGLPGLSWAAGVSVAGQAGWHFAPRLNPGVALVGLAFAAIPAGTWIALRREAGLAPGAAPPQPDPDRPDPDLADDSAEDELLEELELPDELILDEAPEPALAAVGGPALPADGPLDPAPDSGATPGIA